MSPGIGIACSASFSGSEAECTIATVDCILLGVSVVATDCVVVVVAVAVVCGLLVGAVAGVWAASGAAVEPGSSVFPVFSSIVPSSTGEAWGSI